MDSNCSLAGFAPEGFAAEGFAAEGFAAVIIGAGPAGGQCARRLAQAGYRVLLVEQHGSFEHNNYSSAGSPLETLVQFDLPDRVVARFWRKLELVTTQVYRAWESDQNLGVVFDFAKLRAFLAEETAQAGGQVWLGHRYLNHQIQGEQVTVRLRRQGGAVVKVKTNLLIDGTGYARAVIYGDKRDRPPFLKGKGIEYLIRVKPEVHQNYDQSLVFFLGYRWSPKGYSWIFPMDNFQLKVGSALYDAPHRLLTSVKPLREYTQAIIRNYLKLEETDYELIEIHGSMLEYSSGLQDRYFGDRVIAIGDAVSTVNFLGGEGIRHGMKGAEIAVKHIKDYLSGNSTDFLAYQQECQQFFGEQWNLSDRIARKVYLEYSDRRIDQGVSYLKYLSTEEVVEILFDYRFQKVVSGLQRYLLYQRDKLWQLIKKLLRV